MKLGLGKLPCMGYVIESPCLDRLKLSLTLSAAEQNEWQSIVMAQQRVISSKMHTLQ